MADLKTAIQTALRALPRGDFRGNAIGLLNALGYASAKQI